MVFFFKSIIYQKHGELPVRKLFVNSMLASGSGNITMDHGPFIDDLS